MIRSVMEESDPLSLLVRRIDLASPILGVCNTDIDHISALSHPAMKIILDREPLAQLFC